MNNTDRFRTALKMRLAGATYREIAKRLGVCVQRGHQVVAWKIKELLDPLHPPDNPEDQYLADAIVDSPYLAVHNKTVFLDNQQGNYK